MNILDWATIRAGVEDRFVEEMVSTLDCGPFDGGCMVVALALQRLLGGEIMVLERADGTADHAVLSVHDVLVDFDGPASADALLRRFNRSERASCVAVRPARSDDLPDAPRNADLVERLAGIVEESQRSTPTNGI